MYVCGFDHVDLGENFFALTVGYLDALMVVNFFNGFLVLLSLKVSFSMIIFAIFKCKI